ncbi:hypothetical protein [Defluviimonas sp. SAOS-178_SWC]|uniref:hypothetical protein n=1 Tax=Defluviimonas sp. SAOS-178_SWC TaxID=3121287 RepID=UPI003221E96F
MDRTHAVMIDLPEALLIALGQAARNAGCDPSDYVRATLRSALDQTPARLRAEDEVIRHAVHLASDWFDLQRRLRASGYVFRRAPEGGLAIHSWPLDRPLMRIEQLGLSHAGLVLKFRAPFPGDLRHGSSATSAKDRAAPVRPGRAA